MIDFIKIRNLSYKNAKIENANAKDWPDFKSATLLHAESKYSTSLTKEELAFININRRDIVLSIATWLFHSRAKDSNA